MYLSWDKLCPGLSQNKETLELVLTDIPFPISYHQNSHFNPPHEWFSGWQNTLLLFPTESVMRSADSHSDGLCDVPAQTISTSYPVDLFILGQWTRMSECLHFVPRNFFFF